LGLTKHDFAERQGAALEYAVAYAGLGFAVLPINRVHNGKCSCQSSKCKSPGKHPVARLVPRGFKDASADISEVQAWFAEHDYNIGMATGKQSGIVVVDVDGQDGLDSLETLKSQGISFETAYVTTGRGRHYYFRYPMGDIHIPSSSGQLAPGIDIRAEGGMVVAPPSLHASGIHYHWGSGATPTKTSIGPLPFDLFLLIPNAKSNTEPQALGLSGSRFNLPERVNDGEGRESTILRYAGYLRSQGISQAEIDRELLSYNSTNIKPPLDDADVLDRARRYATATDGSTQLAAGQSSPISAPQEGDIANGHDFANLHRNHLIYLIETNNWLRYEPPRGWDPASIALVDSAAKQVAYDLLLKAAKEHASHPEWNGKSKLLTRATKAHQMQHMRAMIEMAKSEPGLNCSINDFDSDPMLLGVQNGVVDLRTQVLMPPNPLTRVSKRCSVEYVPKATCPRFASFINEVLPDTVVAGFVQRWFGYCLTGRSTEKVFLMLIGVGDNGKSVLVEVLKWLLGGYAAKIDTELLMAQPRSPQGPSPEILDIKGRRLIYANETSEGQQLSDARVKDLTGGDTLAARPLYGKTRVEFSPTHKLMMIGNHKPKITDNTSGMWNRVVLVPFEVVVPRNQRDTQLLDKLKLEGPGILNWALDGLTDFKQNGLAVPDKLRAATQAYREEQDLIGEWLVDHCTRGDSLSCKASDAYRAFQQ